MSSELKVEGKRSHDWARTNMPAYILTEANLRKQIRKSGRNPFNGKLIAACLHISKETSVLVRSLANFGAQVVLVAANPLSSQSEVISFLRSTGIEVNAKRDETTAEYKNEIGKAARKEPDLIIDDGGELHIAYERSGKRSCIGGTDETTSGTTRLQALSRAGRLRYPVIAVNEAKTKHIFDNKYGTGQSAIDGILRATGLLLASKKVVVAGYGWVGSGVAARARGMGARVIVTEVDPMRALEAYLDGYEVLPMNKAAEIGELFLTCTGQTSVIRREHFLKMNDGAIVGNVGHFNTEIDVTSLFVLGTKLENVRQGLTRVQIGNKSIYLLNQGRVVNLVSAEGHPPEVMQFSFSNQLLCLHYIASGKMKRENLVHGVPEEIDHLVSNFALEAFRLKIDKLGQKQKKYAGSFER